MADLELALRIRSDLRNVQRQLDRMEKTVGRTGRQANQAAGGFNRMSSAGSRLRQVLASVGVALAVRQIVRASDEYANLRSQLRLVTGSQQELDQTFKDAAELAQDTRQSVSSVVNLYARLKRSTEELGVSNDELLTVTRAINQSFVVSGAGAQEAAAATLQLSQGLASGALRGEELNSVLENSPRLARAIADGLGVTIGELRELGAEGRLTAQAVFRALQRTAGTIDREFGRLPRTVGQALQQLRNDLLLTFGETDTGPLIEGIDDLRELVTDPNFQESVLTLANGMLRLAGAAGEFLGFAEFVGQNIGLFSPDENDLRDLQQLESQIRDALNSGPLDRLRFFGPGGFVEFFSDEELEQELADVQARIAAILDSQSRESINRTISNPIADATNELSNALERSTNLLGEDTTAAEKRADEQRKFVEALEQEAELFQASDAEARRFAISQQELTGELLDRAEAADEALRAQEALAQAAEDAEEVESLQVRLLRAQGNEAEAARREFEQEFGELLDRLEARGDTSGQRILDNLLDLRQLQARLTDAEREVDQVLQELGRREQSIDTERQAGLISEADARRQLLELHRETAAALEDQRPILEELAQQPGEVGEAASRALAQLDGQMQRLRSTTTLLEETLRTGIERGLSDAILGLADGTESLGGAIRSLGQSAAQALAEMAAAEIASSITSGLFGGGGGSGGGLGGVASIAAGLFGLAEGGQVSAPGDGSRDTVLAGLANKEFVTRAAVTEQPGALAFLQDFNRRGMQALLDFVPGQATGGLAGVPAPAAPPPSLGASDLPEPANAFSANLQNNLSLNLIDDPERITSALRSRAGEEAITVMISRNPQKFRQLLKV